MDRRDFVLSGLASMAATPVFASAKGSKMPSLGVALAECQEVGLRCVQQCKAELANGNKEMAACLDTVLDMLAACEALQKLSAYQSKLVAKQGVVAAEACDTCEKACEKHAKHMAICAECAEACKKCAQLCREVR